MSKPAKFTVQWKRENEQLFPQLYRVGANNELIELKKDEEDDFQTSLASGQISLWQ